MMCEGLTGIEADSCHPIRRLKALDAVDSWTIDRLGATFSEGIRGLTSPLEMPKEAVSENFVSKSR
jgi:hypothetical protein